MTTPDFEARAREITDWATQVAELSFGYGLQLNVYISTALAKAYEEGKTAQRLEDEHDHEREIEDILRSCG